MRKAISDLPLLNSETPTRGITSLHLHHFRCYSHFALSTSLEPIVITGPNGAWKTNLLEAISFLIPGRGLRRARLTDVKQKGTEGIWAVSAKLAHDDVATQISTGLDPEGGDKDRRLLKINGEKMKNQFALSEWVTITWLTPQMDRFFSDASSSRRRFLDRLVYGFDPMHARRLSRYERLLKERSQLLRQGRYDHLWASALEDSLASEGLAIAAARRTIVEHLNQVLTNNPSPFPKALLKLQGELEDLLEEESALAVEEMMQKKLMESRSIDAITGGAQFGPHRSDLIVTYVAKGMDANFCSTGEQKALLLSVVLGCAQLQATYKSTVPLLLLDEVAAHLDEDRRSALFEEVLRLKMQVWMTGTEREVFNLLEEKAQFIRIEEAHVASS